MGPQGQAGRGTGAEGKGRAQDRGSGAGRVRSRTSRWCGASPPVSNRCRCTTPTTSTSPSTTSTPTWGTCSPPNPPGPPTHRPQNCTATPRTVPPPRHESREGTGADGRCLGGAGVRRNRRRSRGRSRHGGHRGPGAIGPGTRTRSPTPWGARPSPWLWRCMGD